MGTLFISHSSNDDAIVRALQQALGDLGQDVWTDSRQLRGDPLWPDIQRAIEDAEAYAILVSPSALQSSWVGKELRHALEVQKHRGRDGYPVIPLSLDRTPLGVLEVIFGEPPRYIPLSSAAGGVEAALDPILVALGKRESTDVAATPQPYQLERAPWPVEKSLPEDRPADASTPLLRIDEQRIGVHDEDLGPAVQVELREFILASRAGVDADVGRMRWIPPLLSIKPPLERIFDASIPRAGRGRALQKPRTRRASTGVPAGKGLATKQGPARKPPAGKLPASKKGTGPRVSGTWPTAPGRARVSKDRSKAPAARPRTPERKPLRTQDVMLSATHPRVSRPGDSFLVDIILHLRGAAPRASPRTAASVERAVVRLRAGARLRVEIQPPPGITARELARNVVWRSPRSSVSFPLQSSAQIKSGTHILTVVISTAGPRGVGLARFDVALEIAHGVRAARAVSTVIRRLPTSYFASYARQDWEEVRGRVSAIEAIGGDVFVDCLDISEGELWETQIRRQVQARDGFLLFWSKAARDSKWVDREWRHRLRHRGIASITPNALEPPQACPPPRLLGKLQFGSRFLEVTRQKTRG